MGVGSPCTEITNDLKIKKIHVQPGGGGGPSTLGVEADRCLEFEANLVCRANSRTAKATHRETRNTMERGGRGRARGGGREGREGEKNTNPARGSIDKVTV